MYRKVTLDKISNLVRVTPTPYPFCIAWSFTYIMIKFISIWHPPYGDVSFFGLYFFIAIFFASIFAWARRVINTNCATKPYIYYIYTIIENYEKYGYLNIDTYRNMTFREFTYSDNSQLYEFTYLVKINYITGFQLFLWSEFMVFFSLIWAYCHSAFSPSIWHGALWPPVYLTYFNWEGAPQYMTALLFASSAFTNWTDFSIRTKGNTTETSSALGHVLIIGLFFLILQVWEYSISILSWKDSIYSCTFYSVTAMHGLHVIVGMFFITVCLCRIIYDPYIRIDGLYYKKLKKKNLEQLYDFKIIIIKNYQIISGRHLVNHFLIKKEYNHKLGILLSFFPYLLRPHRALLIKVLKQGALPYYSRVFPIKTIIRTKPIKIDIIIRALKYLLLWNKNCKIGAQWEQKFRTWLAAASFNLYVSFFNRSLSFIKILSKYLNKNMHKLKYKFLIQFGYFMVKLLIIKVAKFFFFSKRSFYFNWIYKSVYNLEYYSLILLDINIIQKNKAYPIFCNELLKWLNFQINLKKKIIPKFIWKLKFFYSYITYINIIFNYEKLIHLCFWFSAIQILIQIGEKYYWLNISFNLVLTFFIYSFYIALCFQFDTKIKGTYSMMYRYWKFFHYCKLILITEVTELLWPSHHISWVSEIINKWEIEFNKFNLKYILPKTKKKIFPSLINSSLNLKHFEIYFKQPNIILKLLSLVEDFWLKIYQMYPLSSKVKYFTWWPITAWDKSGDSQMSRILLILVFDLIFIFVIKPLHRYFIYYIDPHFYGGKYYYMFKGFPLKLEDPNMKKGNYHKKEAIIYYKYWSYFNFNLFNFNKMDNFYIFEYYLVTRRYIKNLIKLYKKIYYIKKYVAIKHLTIFFYCLKYMLTNKKKNISIKYSLFLNYVLFLKSYKINSNYYYLNWYDTIGYLSYTNSQYIYYLNCFFSNNNKLNFLQSFLKVKIVQKVKDPFNKKILYKAYYFNNFSDSIKLTYLIQYFNYYLIVKIGEYTYLKKVNNSFLGYLSYVSYWSHFHNLLSNLFIIYMTIIKIFFSTIYFGLLSFLLFVVTLVINCTDTLFIIPELSIFIIPELISILNSANPLTLLYFYLKISKVFFIKIFLCLFWIIIKLNLLILVVELSSYFFKIIFFFYNIFKNYFIAKQPLFKTYNVKIMLNWIKARLKRDWLHTPKVYLYANISYKNLLPWKGCQNGMIFIGLIVFSWNFYIYEYFPSWWGFLLLDFYNTGQFFGSVKYFSSNFLYFQNLFFIIFSLEVIFIYYKKNLKKYNYLTFKHYIDFFESLTLPLKFYKFPNKCYYNNYYNIIVYFQSCKSFINLEYNKYWLFLFDNFIKIIILTYNSKFIIIKYFYKYWQFSLKHIKFLKHNNFIEETDYIFSFLYHFSVSYFYSMVGILCVWLLLYKLMLGTKLFKKYLVNFYIILSNINYWSIYFLTLHLMLFTKTIYYMALEIIFNYILMDILNYYKGLNKIIYKLFSYFSRTLIKRKFYFNKFKWYYLNFSTTEWFIFFRTSAWYWHFVDIIWFMVYAICYVM